MGATGAIHNYPSHLTLPVQCQAMFANSNQSRYIAPCQISINDNYVGWNEQSIWLWDSIQTWRIADTFQNRYKPIVELQSQISHNQSLSKRTFASLLKWVKEKKGTYKRYAMEDGLFCYRTDEYEYWRLCLSDVDSRNMVMHQNHDLAIAGHAAFVQIYGEIAQSYYWPSMSTYIHGYNPRHTALNHIPRSNISLWNHVLERLGSKNDKDVPKLLSEVSGRYIWKFWEGLCF